VEAVVAGVAGLWCTTMVTGYVVIFVQLVILVAAAVLWIVKGIVWRIAEYNKGAWAALTALLTVLLDS
jgi:hypothetical protein